MQNKFNIGPDPRKKLTFLMSNLIKKYDVDRFDEWCKLEIC